MTGYLPRIPEDVEVMIAPDGAFAVSPHGAHFLSETEAAAIEVRVSMGAEPRRADVAEGNDVSLNTGSTRGGTRAPLNRPCYPDASAEMPTAPNPIQEVDLPRPWLRRAILASCALLAAIVAAWRWV